MPASPPAAVTPGDLYVDLQSRALWLGVDVAVVPAGVVLISDIVDTYAQIAAAIVTAGAYTDALIATRAPTVHAHVSTSITDFNTAVLAVMAANPAASIPPGLIALWSGPVSDVGVGVLAGWHLCDGAGGTPDLRDKFVMGAGNVAAGSTNPAATAATSSAGAHTPSINATTLTIAQIPAHLHSINLSDNATVTTSPAGAHSHDILPDGRILTTAGGFEGTAGGSSGHATPITDTTPAHTHSVSVTINIVGNTSVQGSGASHTHTADPVAAHTHTITSANLRAALPYYALAYIMKL